MFSDVTKNLVANDSEDEPKRWKTRLYLSLSQSDERLKFSSDLKTISEEIQRISMQKNVE